MEARTYHLRSVRARRAHELQDRDEHPTEKLYRTYEDRFLAYLDDHGFEPELKALNAALVEDCALWMREHPLKTPGRRGGAQAIRMFYVVMKIWARFLTERGVFRVDPLVAIRPPRVIKLHRKPFSEDEARHILMAVAEGLDPIRDRAIMLLLASTGCRVGELSGLEVDDVIDSGGAVTGAAIFRKTKGGVPRTVMYGRRDKPHGGRTVQAVRQWLRVRPAQPGVCALFTTAYGYPLETRRIQEMHRRYGDVAGVKECTPHKWRHAQPLYSPVLTPCGWRTMGALSVGDFVFGADGRPTQVLGVYPQGPQEIVRIRFSDGATVECTLDHLWAVRRPLSQQWPRNADEFRVMPTAEIIAAGGKWFTPTVRPVHFSESESLPVDPYTVGALLGDGTVNHNVTLATAAVETEVIARIMATLPADHVATRQRDHYLIGAPVRGWRRGGRNLLLNGARELNLDGVIAVNKVIPPSYLLASVDARTELLRGLMDTDGYADEHGCAEFTTISPALAAGVCELVRSLGGLAVVRAYQPYMQAKHGAYRVTVRVPFTPFHMTRKRERFEGSAKKMPLLRTITVIEPLGVTDCVCIQVANPDGLYVTQDYVLTHNTHASEGFAEGLRETDIRERLGHVSTEVLRDYLTIGDRTREVAAERADLAEKWRL